MPLMIAVIKRRGKNLIEILAMNKYIKITPIACFGWRCDLAIDLEETGAVKSKVVVMDEYCSLRKYHF
jgi:hypothetical protein